MKNITLLLVALSFIKIEAQNVAPTVNSIPFIEVIGTAKKEIEPNQIFVSITLSEKSIDNKKYSIEAQEEKLKQSLQKWNIDLTNLTLSDFNSKIIRDKKNEIGFKQSKEYVLLLKSADEVSKIFKDLFEANIKEADVISVQHTNILQYVKEARIDALKAAKEKAQYLVEAIGNKIDQPLEIIEQSRNSDDFNYYRGNVYLKKEEAEQTISSSEFKKIVINISYKVKYSIK
ncbi:SIMPL domain-containing protein [Flavobacterium aquatile]|uniref:Periplasmic immunogenic protein n=1 Tax=Flavobacterium aquatile LMG 4008 = ATCC 11947 TaxID=1453498 RepID=A0A095STE7_9FLAO|nr:SIMPL domain-containing protein [Flavobacterium aquatile]KGD67872.1 hypothetical protein LG45_12210 [Flavobacterium aquatile LMG 4008 = ATCC 11947]OXA67733.1 SIMPL domain-containing protein [Flavobacterium aquatile LMG 4008 = ATCC 11947]GEC79998.1 SIMPL domain-containing protein [Flavobacterium aquatile]